MEKRYESIFKENNDWIFVPYNSQITGYPTLIRKQFFRKDLNVPENIVIGYDPYEFEPNYYYVREFDDQNEFKTLEEALNFAKRKLGIIIPNNLIAKFKKTVNHQISHPPEEDRNCRKIQKIFFLQNLPFVWLDTHRI